MAKADYKRKLTAIMSADVQGYSRLMRDDEEATFRILNRYKETMAMLIERHHGRLVDSTGDNLLAEFESVVGALRSAVTIQRVLKIKCRRNPPLQYCLSPKKSTKDLHNSKSSTG